MTNPNRRIFYNLFAWVIVVVDVLAAFGFDSRLVAAIRYPIRDGASQREKLLSAKGTFFGL